MIEGIVQRLGVFLLASPALALVMLIAYQGWADYSRLEGDIEYWLRGQFIWAEPNFHWPDADMLNAKWDQIAAPIFAEYKLRVFYALLAAPVFVALLYIIPPLKYWPKYVGEKPKHFAKAAKVYLTVCAILVVVGSTSALTTHGGVPISRCTSLSLAACVGRHAFVVGLSIWTSVYFLWAVIEFIRLGRVESNS